MEEVTITDSQGNKILGTISIPQEAESVVIISHGFSSSKESKLYIELQDELNKAGIGTLRYDYYGHGKLYCDGKEYAVTKDVTLTKCVESIKAAISFVRSKGNFKIGLVGSSFGGLISIIAASQERDICALALKSPVTEPIEFWKQRLGDARIQKWKEEGIMHYDERGENFELDYEFWKDLQNYDLEKLAKNIVCPALIIHGGGDTVVPIKQSQDLAEILHTKVNIVKGANHNYAAQPQHNEMKKLIIDFIVRELESKHKI